MILLNTILITLIIFMSIVFLIIMLLAAWTLFEETEVGQIVVKRLDLTRCKDCAYHGEHKTCMRGDGLVVASDYDYCSNGVRKEE